LQAVVRLDITGADLRSNIGRIMDEISNLISFGVGRKNAERVDSSALEKTQDA
jgi:tRNA-splicing ligase RtcB (3'-phosphate/5'-hydroxy nucleic acid ligase)